MRKKRTAALRDYLLALAEADALDEKRARIRPMIDRVCARLRYNGDVHARLYATELDWLPR